MSEDAAVQGNEVADQGTPDDVLLQDWAPMSQCLDWRIGRVAWNALGGRLFTDGDVPNLAHDSGTHSRRCAELLHNFCETAGARLPETITVIEYGMGTGLFLRYTLDAFQALCGELGTPYYDRLRVFATDVSGPMLQKARDRGVFGAHKERVQLAFADILRPGALRLLDGDEALDITGQVHAAFANYALDLMPIDIFRRLPGNGQRRWEAVLVRTWLRDVAALPAFAELDAEGVTALVEDGSPQAIAALSPIYSLLQTELRTFPFDVATHPDAALLRSYADLLDEKLGAGHELLEEGTVVYHSGGAIEAAERVSEALADDGFALFRDVGLHTPELAAVARAYLQFGPTVAAAVNVLELDHHFGGSPRSGAVCVGPGKDGVRDQVVRVMVRGENDLQPAVARIFDGDQAQQMASLLDEARRKEDAAEALELYRQALATEPDNWALMQEAAARALHGGLDPQLAVLIATRGLEINTEHSADLWTLYGDAVWASGDSKAARAAYGYALAVHPQHPRAHYGTAFVDAESGRFPSAFAHIGQALAHDHDGRLRADVLQLLDVCLRGQSRAREAHWKRMADKSAR